MIKAILALILGIIGRLAYHLCIPVMFLLIACKLWYAPYAWDWINTIGVPIGCGVCGIIAICIAEDMTRQ